MAASGVPKRRGRKPKLTDEQKREVREMYAEKHPGWSTAQIARVMQCSTATVLKALNFQMEVEEVGYDYGTKEANDRETERVREEGRAAAREGKSPFGAGGYAPGDDRRAHEWRQGFAQVNPRHPDLPVRYAGPLASKTKFRTADGYTLWYRKSDRRWADSADPGRADMLFEDIGGRPVDAFGSTLEGEFIS